MAELTFAERVARTVELDAEIRSLWPAEFVFVNIHHLTHQEVHEGSLTSAVACWIESQQRWSICVPLAGKYTSPDLFATAAQDCATCRALVDEAKARGEASRG